MRIGLLVCDHVDDRFRIHGGDYPDMFDRLVRGGMPAASLVPFDVVGGTIPDSPRACDAWIATGSRRSVYDDIPWIHAAAAFVRDIHDADVPFAGICFGHQLLAHALGGRVERAAGGWGVGAHCMAVASPESWMHPPLAACRLLYMHQDQVVAVPENATVLGRTDHCPMAMMGVGSSMVGLQAHPEFTAAYAHALVDARAERIGAEKAAEARASLDAPTDASTMGRWLIQFLAQAA